MKQKIKAALKLLLAFLVSLCRKTKETLKAAHQYAVFQCLRFAYNTRAESTGASKFVMLGVGVVISVMMLPPVADTILGINTTSWTFTGASAAKTMMYLIPFIYITSVVIYIVKSAIS